MAAECHFDSTDIILFIFKIIFYCILWTVTGICLYFLATDRSFRKRVSNVIITNLLVSDSLSALLASIHRAYLLNCEIKPYVECTIITFFTRTFGYTSMAFLVLLNVDRYLKISKNLHEYAIIMNKKRLSISIAAIWVGFVFFSIVTTPYWIYLSIPRYRNSTVPVCVYSNSMEPLVSFITLFFSQFLSMIAMVVINVHLMVKLRKIMKEANKTIGITKEQAEKNQRMIKNVEINVFIMSFLLTALNLVVFGLTVMDLIEFSNDLNLIKIKIPDSVFKIFAILISLYPFCEAMVCFTMNEDIMGRMKRLFLKQEPEIYTIK
ncbi:hypothetical protein RF11_02357 [Thelohanellus kitauei]|uniref:G-protein coupled receptors family 1 profile domain-containing protein n=1 Tax=Thelohanellus kitauei TaxID=669202 RepID=A0A0C2J6E4_THEKT|nr:hypothetical protein RF11_02357 [Thelohanellus kitauei]